jgi:hypothetical protein
MVAADLWRRHVVDTKRANLIAFAAPD